MALAALSLAAIVIAAYFDLANRVSRIEGQLSVLKDLIESRVVTRTVIFTSTTTFMPPPGGIPGFPPESVILGILLGFALLLAARKVRLR